MVGFFETLLVLGALSSWAFIARYMSTYRWWETGIGRHLVAWSSIVGAFYTYFAVVALWPQLPGRAWIRLGLFVALTTVIVWRFWMFERLRRQSRKGER